MSEQKEQGKKKSEEEKVLEQWIADIDRYQQGVNRLIKDVKHAKDKQQGKK